MSIKVQTIYNDDDVIYLAFVENVYSMHEKCINYTSLNLKME